MNTAWHILGSFDIPPGAITLPASNPYGGGAEGVEITEWTAVGDNKNMKYYIKMFANVNPQVFDFSKADVDGREIKTYNLNIPQAYIPIN